MDEGLFKPTKEPIQRDVTHEEKKRNKSWPSVGFIVAWVLCFVYIVAGAGFVMLYALSFGNDKTYQWMVALIVTFFASVFVYQPIKILLITFVVTACCKRANFDDDHQETDEVSPSVYWDEEAEAEARAKMEAGETRPKRVKEPYQPLFYETIRSEKSKEVEMNTVIKDMLQYFIYLAIIMVISYGTRSPVAYYQRSALERSMIFAGMNCDILPEDDLRYAGG